MPAAPTRSVPWRTILATIGLVLATLAVIAVARELKQILTWLAVAGFFTVVLAPAVDFLERRRMRRGLATAVVFFFGMLVAGAMLYAFIQPLVTRADDLVAALPGFVEDAQEGRGPVGDLIQRLNVDEFIAENQDRWQEAIGQAGAPALDVVRSVASTAFAFVTVMVLTFLMLLEAPKISGAILALTGEQRRERVRAVALDCSRAVSGYVLGNVLISVVAGVATFAMLTAADVPFAAVLALWVAFTDLIPMVGATLGAIPTVLFAFLHSTPAGIAALIFYILYQQFENHFLQPAVMSRTVDLSPLTVLVSVLIGAQLLGMLGALLAIPVAGIVQVVIRDVYDEHRGRLKDEPTIGAEEVPVHAATGSGRPPSDSPSPGDGEPAPSATPAGPM